MTDQRRYAPRFKVALFVHVRAIDAKLQEALTAPLPGIVVDVSEGGVRVDIDGLTEAISQRFAPGVVIAIKFDHRDLKSLGELQITLAWTVGKPNPDGSLKTSLGGPFRQLSVGSRNTLLRFATKNQKVAAPPTQPPSWPGIVARALLFAALFGGGMAVRQCKVDDLTAQNEKLQAQLAEQRQLASKLREDPAKTASDPATSFGVPYTVTGPLAGFEMRNLELIGDDFVGVVANASATAARLKISLEFACMKPGNTKPGQCSCVIPVLRAEAQGPSEFACASEIKPLRAGNVAIRLEQLE